MNGNHPPKRKLHKLATSGIVKKEWKRLRWLGSPS